jgi:hypothetical protein
MNEKEFLELFNRYLKENSIVDYWEFDDEFNKLKNNKDLVKKLSQDKDLVFKLIEHDALFILWMPQELLTEEMIEHILKRRPKAIQYIKNPTEEMCLKAISINAKSIRYIENSNLNFEMIKQAVDQDLEALMYIPYEIINKKNVKYFCKKLAELLEEFVNEEGRIQIECDDCGFEHWYYQKDFNNLMIYLLNFIGE